jgi:hypothetical protein
MRRDRDGSPLDDDPPTVHECAAGWTGEDHHGRPIPCRVCKPWLVDPRTPAPTLTRRPPLRSR